MEHRTFAIWNNIEWALLGLIASLLLYSPNRIDSIFAVGAVSTLLLVQIMAPLPTLNAPILTIIAGGRPELSAGQLKWIVIDALKVGALGAIVWKQADRLMRLLLRSH